MPETLTFSTRPTKSWEGWKPACEKEGSAGGAGNRGSAEGEASYPEHTWARGRGPREQGHEGCVGDRASGLLLTSTAGFPWPEPRRGLKKPV